MSAPVACVPARLSVHKPQKTRRDGSSIRPFLLCDERMPEGMKEELSFYGRVVSLPPHPLLPKPVCAHPDLLCFFDEKGQVLYTYASYFEQNKALFASLPVSVVPLSLQAGDYPNDLHFDQLLCKERIVGRAPFIPEALSWGREIVSVKQGYAKCATLLFGDCAVTADSGIKKALRELGVKVLEIENEGIALPGYDKGFIGGASAVIGKRVCFFGNPLSHPQGEDIIKFVESAGYESLSLCDGVLTDYGGLIVIDESLENDNALSG